MWSAGFYAVNYTIHAALLFVALLVILETSEVPRGRRQVADILVQTSGPLSTAIAKQTELVALLQPTHDTWASFDH